MLRHVLALFYGLHVRRGDLTSAIAHVVQCLEAFHRDTKMQPRERIPRSDCTILREEFLKVLNQHFGASKKHLDWFDDWFTNSPTLASRLDALFDAERDVVGTLFPDEEAAIRAAKYYRNRFAHGLHLDPLPPKKMEDLYWLIERLSLLLCSCLMNWIGIPTEDRKAVFTRSRWYAQVSRSVPQT